MPRYKLTIEYDGTPFVGWQVQATGPVGAGCADRRRRGVLRRAGQGQRRRAHRRRRARARPGGACRPRQGLGASIRCATRSTHICARIRSRCWRPSGCRRRSTRASRRYSGTTSIASSTAAPISLSSAAGLASGRAARRQRPCMSLPCASSATTTSRLSATPNARRSRRSRRSTGSMSTRDRRRRQHRSLGALVPALAGALDGGRAGCVGEGRWSARRSVGRARGPRPHRLRAGGAARGLVSGAGGLLSCTLRTFRKSGNRFSDKNMRKIEEARAHPNQPDRGALCGVSAIASRRRTVRASPPLVSSSRKVASRKARLGEAASSSCQRSFTRVSRP